MMKRRYGNGQGADGLIRPCHVRKELALTPVSAAGAASYIEFWVQPRQFFNNTWQGGEVISLKRIGPNEFKAGSRLLASLEEAAAYVEERLRQYRVPYFGSESWEHPFTYAI